MFDKLDGEIWKSIIGYEGLYEVSSFGRVKSKERIAYNYLRKERLLKPTPHNKGYLKIWLSKDGVRRCYYVHRLVAQNFIDNYDNNLQINHIDCNKTNNTLSNLEVVTHKENMEHAAKNGLMKPRIGVNNPLSRFSLTDIIEIEELRKTMGIVEISKIFSVNHSTISRVLNRKRYKNV